MIFKFRTALTTLSKNAALIATVGVLCGFSSLVAIYPTDKVYAAPNFQMPFPCGESWWASTYSGHGAIDWNIMGGNDEGRTVVASLGGTATAGYDAGSGYYVLIDHGGGWKTRYIHLREQGVSGVVMQGQFIGRVGSTGNNIDNPPAPHLHWEQVYGGVKQYPLYANGAALQPGTAYNSSDPQYVSNNNCGGGVNYPPTRDTVNFTNGDNKEDIAWYEQYPGYPGTLAAINSSGSHQYIGWKEVGIGSADWKGTGDFNGDGKTDIAWHEGTTLTVFTSSGQSFGIAWRMPGIGAPTWAGVGDFNNDGKDDIAWYEQSSSSLAALITNSSGTWMDIAYRANSIGPAGWAGVGDFNGDGKDDVAWHEGSTLTNIASTGTSWGILWRNFGIGAPTWAQVGEFTGDNKDDIAWYESHSSTVATLAGNSLTFDIRGRMYNIGAPTWAYVGNFNGDNKDDIAWYEQNSSSLASFISNGSHFYIGWKALGIGLPNWAGVGDFTGEGIDDIAWHEGSTLTNIASSGSSWGVLWRTPGIGKPLWASRGAFPFN